MRKALVHIGTGKTGSTSIQDYLLNNRIEPVSYPRIYHINHNILEVIYRPFGDWIPMYHRQLGKLSASETAEIKKRLRRKLLKKISGSDNIILSGEVVYRFNASEIRQLKADLEGVGFQDIAVLLYLREPADYYLSNMQQRSRHHSSFQAPGEFLFPYRDLVERWEEVFAEKLIVRPFDRSRFRDRDVVSDFQDVCANHLDWNLPESEKPVLRNPSLSVESITLLQSYRRLMEVDDRFRIDMNYFNLMIRLINMEPNSKLSFTRPKLQPGITDIIRWNHRNELDYLERKGIVFPGIDLSALPSIPASESNGVEINQFRAICTGFNNEAYEELLINVLSDFVKRHVNDSRYLDWLREPYRKVRRWIGWT